MNKHLNYGVYETTETFKSIKQHSCVCFDDMSLVAVTGPAEDEESQKYAQLFAQAPALLRELDNAVTLLEAVRRGETIPPALLVNQIDRAHSFIRKANEGENE
jgi:hypothetical protein